MVYLQTMPLSVTASCIAFVVLSATSIDTTTAQQPGCGLDCHRCTAPFSASGNFECYLCRNSKYLFNDACYDNCSIAPGYIERGGGSFSRICVPRCTGNTWDSTPSGPTATCIAVTPCTGVAYVAVAATPVSDNTCRDARTTLCGDVTTCAYDSLETSYRGFLNTTISGRVCQSWSSQSPHVSSACGVLLTIDY